MPVSSKPLRFNLTAKNTTAMNISPFTRSFTQQEPIDKEAIAAAVEVLQSGRLHRYNTSADELSEAALLEKEFAHYQGARFCLACASGGYSLHIALRAAGLKPGERVLTNAFTLAPVPGAIVNAAGIPVFVETTRNLTIDLRDLEEKILASGARFILLSHMRGHMPDMDELTGLLDAHGVTLIEDCAHTMGARWQERKSGSFGLAGCFSTQTYKHLNAGEGGLLTSDDPTFMARAILMSGSYMLYERHGAAPDQSVFARLKLDTPNLSGRMDNLRASILRPQLKQLDRNVVRWNSLYAVLANRLKTIEALYLPVRPPAEYYVGSSIQFMIPSFAAPAARAFVAACAQLGVELKWFGNDEPIGFTSTYKSWRYVDADTLPQTDEILGALFDMRIPLTFSAADCEHIAAIVHKVLTDMGLVQERTHG
jgi:dTDP-4-amino-4,6-dideoxygalactose transaminase